MQSGAFLGFLADNKMPVFTIDDAVKVLRGRREYARLFLHRLVKSKMLGRAERGLYYLPERSNEYEIASHVVYPSYISMVSALRYYGLTTQMPNAVYVVSPRRHKAINGVLGYDLIFKSIRKDMMYGYHKESNGNIFMADPEKALVDIFYFRDASDLDHGALEEPSRLDVDKLAAYAKRSRDRFVVKSVADLLREHGYVAQANELESLTARGAFA